MASYDAYDNNKEWFCGYELDEGYLYFFYQNRFPYYISLIADLGDNIQYQERTEQPEIRYRINFAGADAVDGVGPDDVPKVNRSYIFNTCRICAGTYPKKIPKHEGKLAENVSKTESVSTDEMANDWIDENDDHDHNRCKENNLKVEENR